MTPYIYTLFRICLFKAKPQDLPSSLALLINSIVAATLIFIMRNALLASEFSMISMAFMQILLLGALLYLLLKLFSKSERWLQSATALYGCSAIIVVTVVPFISLEGGAPLISESFNLVKLVVLFSSAWYFSVTVYILKETLEVRMFLAIVIAIVMEIVLAIILIALFGNRLL